MEQAFLQAYDAYADAIFRFCYFRVFHRERARELAQETFLRTWNYLADGNTVNDLRAFLYTTARHLVIDDARQRDRIPVSLDVLVEEGREPVGSDGRALGQQLDLRAALQVVQELAADDREVLLLRYVDGLPPRDIAIALGVTPNVISVRLHRARQRLRALLATQS
ncbi:sigma-70 family RNA polymerase sigma factor [Candidatus Uhrbacteria bacterium]|nr:sigma-70 family RNA polymerase sigma factor [Candidatus Uhrbacteria bacterium]